MPKLFALLLILSALVLSCDKADSPDPETISQTLAGTWIREKSYLCAGVNWTDQGIDHSLTFTDKSYSRDVRVQGLCGAKRTGLYSINQSTFTLGFSSINCSTSDLCPADYQIQQGTENKNFTFDCPGVLKTDGQNFILQLQGDNLILTPRDGIDKGCTYTYKKSS